jgi:glutathione synthase/RimK-type ligase-like ATP-grasp enzyme
MQRVLILAPESDFHALAIQALLRERGCDADIVDTAGFPSRLTLNQSSGSSTTVELDEHPLSSYRSIWWRRPYAPELPEDLRQTGEEARFANRECREALWGALHASAIPIFNRPEMESIATYKPYQIRVAKDCGFAVPDTLITNNHDAVLRFRARGRPIVYKGFSATTIRMTETRLLRDEDLDDLWRLKYAPVIFQDYIELGREYRATVVRDRVFAAEIVTDNPAAKADWRLDPGYKVRPITLSSDIEANLVRLLKTLHLASGSIDLRESRTKELYFLEVNPSGQFLFLDVFAGLDVGNAFCDLLLCN